jgi:3-dehydroquinate synthase
MKTIRQRFTVPFAYPVHFTRRVFAKGNALLASTLDCGGLTPLLTHGIKSGAKPPQSKVLLVIDSSVADSTPGLLQQIDAYFHAHGITFAAPPLIVPGGENAKNGWGNVREIMTRAASVHLDRHSFIIAIGGGCVLDMAGFAASLIHRGVRFVRLPTTVLAQNDAGVGVKNGMNEGGAKNFIGTFAPPFAVINDFAFLRTLPQGDWISGVAEAFKVAIIADKKFFKELCALAPKLRKRNQAAMERVVYRTAQLHLKHIATSGDPFETGNARPLDFGHWAAHRLELLSNFTLTHGQAVAIGIALDSTYACLKRMIPEAECAAILKGLSDCGLPVYSPLLECPELLEGLEQFREHLGGKLCITLPYPIGAKREVRAMDAHTIQDAIARLR